MSNKEKENANSGLNLINPEPSDWVLVAVFFIVVGILWMGVVQKNDFIIGELLPYSLMAVVTILFLDYFRRVFSFMRVAKEDMKNKQS